MFIGTPCLLLFLFKLYKDYLQSKKWDFNEAIFTKKIKDLSKCWVCGRYKELREEKIHTGLVADCGKVTFPYPLHPEYQVVCPSIRRTYLWLKEFYSSTKAKPNPAPQPNPEPEELEKSEKGSDSLPEIDMVESITENENQNLKEDIKLLKESSPSQSSISKITEKKLSTPELPIVSNI